MFTLKKEKSRGKEEEDMIEIQAHRGNCELYRENTLQAFAAAWQAGADWIELDVHLTKDHHVVVFHDFSIPSGIEYILSSKQSVEGKLIKDLSVSEIKNILLPSIDPKSSQEFKIPQLEEVIDLILSSKHPKAQTIKLNIELKKDPRFPHLSADPLSLVKNVLKILEDKKFIDRVQFSSFDPEILSALKAINSKALAILLCDKNTLSFIETTSQKNPLEYVIHFAAQMSIEGLAIDHTLIDSHHTVDLLKSKKFTVIAWTANEIEQWQKLQSFGVDAIITDRPAELYSFLHRNKQTLKQRASRSIRRSRKVITSALGSRELP